MPSLPNCLPWEPITLGSQKNSFSGELKRDLGVCSKDHVRNHESPQLYDIVHFENRLSWLCFELLQKVFGDVFLTYKPMIIP